MKSALPQKIHTYIYIFALIVLVVGLPLSKFLMSVSQIILACNWFLEGNVKNKISSFSKNKPALILSSVLLLHFLGLLYTTDFAYALKDIRIKSPLFIIPIIISTSQPLSKKNYLLILKLFLVAIVLATIISTFILLGFTHRQIVDIRNSSIFISHIIFGLLVDVAVFISTYFLYNSENKLTKNLWIILIGWLLFFLFLMESITGFSILFFVLIILLIYFVFKSPNKILKIIGILILLSSIGFVYFYVASIQNEINKKEVIDFSKLPSKTPYGHRYENELNSTLTENGHLVWVNVCWEELECSWTKRSTIPLASNDLKGNLVRYTLVRFLASKGLRKDADGMSKLSDLEIKSIERGVPNVLYQKMSGLRGRIHEILWEIDLYKKTGDPNGHSITQRFEYWKTAMQIIKKNPLIGVGTGDIQHAFDDEYEKTNSPLSKDLRFRSHNQFLSIAVSFGLIGLIWFMFSLIYPMIKLNMTFDYLYITFLIITIVSFFTEDALETQAGITFYVFFNSFFLFAHKKDDLEN